MEKTWVILVAKSLLFMMECLLIVKSVVKFWEFIMFCELKSTLSHSWSPMFKSIRSTFTSYRRLCWMHSFIFVLVFKPWIWSVSSLFVFWSATLLSDMWVSSVTVSTSHTSLFPGPWPCGQAAYFSIFAPLPINTPPILCLCIVISEYSFQRAPCWQPSMLLPLGLALPFLCQPQGLPSLGFFQCLPCERFPPSLCPEGLYYYDYG